MSTTVQNHIERGRERAAGLPSPEAHPKGRPEAEQRSAIPILRSFEHLLESLSDAVVVFDANGYVIHANPSYQELVGLGRSELLGRRVGFPCWSRETANGTRDCFDTMAKSRCSGHRSLEFRDSSGMVVPVVLNWASFRNSRGQVLAHIAVVIAKARECPACQGRCDMCLARERERKESLQRIAVELEGLGIATGLFPRRIRNLSAPDLRSLSTREWDVLRSLCDGKRVPTIARTLHISPHTVRNHLKSIFRKVGVGTQHELLEKLMSSP